MSATPHERAERALSALHRLRAGGERFVGAFLPAASARRMQAVAVAELRTPAAQDPANPVTCVVGHDSGAAAS